MNIKKSFKIDSGRVICRVNRLTENRLQNLKTRFLNKTNKSRFLSNLAYSTDNICPTLNILEKEPLKYTIPKRKLITLFTKNDQ